MHYHSDRCNRCNRACPLCPRFQIRAQTRRIEFFHSFSHVEYPDFIAFAFLRGALSFRKTIKQTPEFFRKAALRAFVFTTAFMSETSVIL